MAVPALAAALAVVVAIAVVVAGSVVVAPVVVAPVVVARQLTDRLPLEVEPANARGGIADVRMSVAGESWSGWTLPLTPIACQPLHCE